MFNNLMVVAAFRYCLGRRTYIVSACVDWLIDIWSQLNLSDQEGIIRETISAIENNRAGSDCDILQWEKLITFAKDYEWGKK